MTVNLPSLRTEALPFLVSSSYQRLMYHNSESIVLIPLWGLWPACLLCVENYSCFFLTISFTDMSCWYFSRRLISGSDCPIRTLWFQTQVVSWASLQAWSAHVCVLNDKIYILYFAHVLIPAFSLSPSPISPKNMLRVYIPLTFS